jgi:hypothetical protein
MVTAFENKEVRKMENINQVARVWIVEQGNGQGI